MKRVLYNALPSFLVWMCVFVYLCRRQMKEGFGVAFKYIPIHVCQHDVAHSADLLFLQLFWKLA